MERCPLASCCPFLPLVTFNFGLRLRPSHWENSAIPCSALADTAAMNSSVFNESSSSSPLSPASAVSMELRLKFGNCTKIRKEWRYVTIRRMKVEEKFSGSYSRRCLDLAHRLIEIEASHLVSGLRRSQQSWLDHQTTVVARFRLLDPRKFRAYLRQV